MAEFPAMPLWTDAYLADTGHLTTIEHGAYFLLLMTMWRAGGSLPNDDKKLSRFARMSAQQWERVKPSLMEFFTIKDDEITQGRLTDELAFVKRRSKRQSENARANARKNKTSVSAMAQPKLSLAEPNASQTVAPTPTPTDIEKRDTVVSPKKRAARLPDDWTIPDEFQDWCLTEWPSMRIEFIQGQAARFKDYWIAKSGKDATKTDWLATWRNWMRRAVEDAGRRAKTTTPQTTKPKTRADAFRQLREAINNEPDGNERNSGSDGGGQLLLPVPER